jgi:hypothetical protein
MRSDIRSEVLCMSRELGRWVKQEQKTTENGRGWLRNKLLMKQPRKTRNMVYLERQNPSPEESSMHWPNMPQETCERDFLLSCTEDERDSHDFLRQKPSFLFVLE